ncbi:MAG: hypothetical protein R3E68_09410 [Burkholderiaceae bacterium]
MSVGWRGNGRQLLAAGTGYEQIGAHRLYVFDAGSGAAVGSHLLARDSVLDLQAVDADRTAYASFDGRWGIVDLARNDVQSRTPACPTCAARATCACRPTGRGSGFPSILGAASASSISRNA